MNVPPSTVHANVAGVRLDLNLNVGVRSVVWPDGPEVIVVFGHGRSVGGVAVLRGFGGEARAKSAELLFVSSVTSSRLGQPREIFRRSACPLGIAGAEDPVGEGRGVPLVLLKVPQETQSTPAQQTAPPPGLRRFIG